MARQLRIEFPGAFYHVYSRGNQKQVVFLEDADRYFFSKCLGDAYERFDCVVHAVCLMNNHYHLFIETRRGNLSRIMQFINTTYTVYFNLKHARCGHLFQGRYKAILVEADAYARELSRYIHLNPVRAGIVNSPELSMWSNYREYIGLARPPFWMDTAMVLASFGGLTPESRLSYAEFVVSAIGQELPNPIHSAAASGILGSEDFVNQIKEEFLGDEIDRPDRDRPQLRRLKDKPDLRTIRDVTESFLCAKSRFAKTAAIFISHKYADHKLKTIGEFYQMSVSGISDSCRRMSREISQNETIARVIERIKQRLFLEEEGVKPTFFRNCKK